MNEVMLVLAQVWEQLGWACFKTGVSREKFVQIFSNGPLGARLACNGVGVEIWFWILNKDVSKVWSCELADPDFLLKLRTQLLVINDWSQLY